MTNEALQALIDEFGDRICILIFDNGCRVYIGYDSSPLKSVNDLELKTIGGIDMVGIVKNLSNPKLSRQGAKCMHWHPTVSLQNVIVIDEGFEKYRVDPMDFG